MQRLCIMPVSSLHQISRARDLLRDAWPHLESMLRRSKGRNRSDKVIVEGKYENTFYSLND